MNCFRSLERWDRGFESHSRHGCLREFILFVLFVCRWQVDSSSKESYPLCIGSRNLKSGQGPVEGCRAILIIIIITIILQFTDTDGRDHSSPGIGSVFLVSIPSGLFYSNRKKFTEHPFDHMWSEIPLRRWKCMPKIYHNLPNTVQLRHEFQNEINAIFTYNAVV
jgi:hypothetical protein